MGYETLHCGLQLLGLELAVAGSSHTSSMAVWRQDEVDNNNALVHDISQTAKYR